MPTPDWIEHRRPDGELLGWMVPAGDGFHIIDLLGRQRTESPADWPDAQEALETLGIGYLANRYSLRLPDGGERRVRIGEVNRSGIVVLGDDFGSASAVGGDQKFSSCPFLRRRVCGRSTDARRPTVRGRGLVAPSSACG